MRRIGRCASQQNSQPPLAVHEVARDTGEMRVSARYLLVLVALLFALPAYAADLGPCATTPLSESGNYFSDYEEIEYVNGLLTHHFRVATPTSQRTFTFLVSFFDDECNLGVAPRSFNVTMPAGVVNWSARFISPSQLQIWDDDHATLLHQFAVSNYPLYVSIRFTGIVGNVSSGFTSRAVRLGENALPPPQHEYTAEKNPACPDFNVTEAGIYDSYERAEYVDGLLRVHLRFKTLSGGFRTFALGAYTGDENCANFTRVGKFVNNNATIPPFVRYHSIRFASSTHWDLWDDEREQKIECTGCQGNIPDGTPFVYFDEFNFAAFTNHILETTPFPPTIEIEPEKPDPVIIIPGILGSEQHNGEWIIDPILHTYDDLIATLDANGYTPEIDLFPFPYNWRKSNVETAELLKEKIDEVKEICECDKVDLVAHSMGGLVARQYIQSDVYEDDVDQLIFLGTPHLGAPKAYLMWEGGEVSPVNDFFDELVEKVLLHEAFEEGYITLFEYIRTEPIESVRELLPTYDYVFDGNNLRQYPDNYPQNVFLENLNNNLTQLLNSGVEIHNIVGDTNAVETISGIQATDPGIYFPMWFHGYPDGFYDTFGDHGLILSSGDKTVPLPSATFININSTSTPYIHSALPLETQEYIFSILTGRELSTVSREHSGFDLINLLLFKILSPADLLVIAPDGKKIGKDLNGQEVNEILNAFYTGFGTATEYITILNPLDGEYKIYTQGTDTGPYTVETSYVSEDQTVDTSFTGNTNPGLLTELDLSLDNENPGQMDLTPTDVEPPVITVTQPESKDYLRSEMLPVAVSAEDENSGVFALETFLDGLLISNEGSVDLFFQLLGMHTILASSTDNVGNATTTSREFRVVATQKSTLSDLERTYQLGWMNKLTYTILKPLTTSMFRAVSNSPKFIAPSLYRAILKQLDQRRGKGLNQEGYQLLKEDVKWLISN